MARAVERAQNAMSSTREKECAIYRTMHKDWKLDLIGDGATVCSGVRARVNRGPGLVSRSWTPLCVAVESVCRSRARQAANLIM
jgi:hypothetical protein